MSGFPRPVYAGDFQAVKFYDLPDDHVEPLPASGTAVPLGRLVSRNVVAGHLYEVEFGPFYLLSDGTPNEEEYLRLIMTFRAPSDASPDIIRRYRFDDFKRRETHTKITGVFVAPETGEYRIAVVAQRVGTSEASANLGLILDNSLLGIRGVASTDTDFTIQTTPEV